MFLSVFWVFPEEIRCAKTLATFKNTSVESKCCDGKENVGKERRVLVNQLKVSICLVYDGQSKQGVK